MAGASESPGLLRLTPKRLTYRPRDLPGSGIGFILGAVCCPEGSFSPCMDARSCGFKVAFIGLTK